MSLNNIGSKERNALGGLGLLLMLSGFIKFGFSAFLAGELLLPACLGGEQTIHLGPQFTPALMHCWGCYTALLGAGLVVASLRAAHRKS